MAIPNMLLLQQKLIDIFINKISFIILTPALNLVLLFTQEHIQELSDSSPKTPAEIKLFLVSTVRRHTIVNIVLLFSEVSSLDFISFHDCLAHF